MTCDMEWSPIAMKLQSPVQVSPYAGATRERASSISAEPRRSIEKEFPAELKDELEWRLRELVCTERLDVRVAQRAIAEDWIETYRRYVR